MLGFVQRSSAKRKEKSELEYTETCPGSLLLTFPVLGFDEKYLIWSQVSLTGKWAT